MRPFFRLLMPIILVTIFACNSESEQSSTAQETETASENIDPASYQHVDSAGILNVDYGKKAELEAQVAAKTNQKSSPVDLSLIHI